MTQLEPFARPDRGQGAGHGMALGLRRLDLKARQPGPLLMRRAVASFLCFFDEEVHRTAAITCSAHIDEARVVVECLQIQRADWCIALFCGLQRYPRPCLAAKTLLGLSTLPGLASRDLTTRCHAA